MEKTNILIVKGDDQSVNISENLKDMSYELQELLKPDLKLKIH